MEFSHIPVLVYFTKMTQVLLISSLCASTYYSINYLFKKLEASVVVHLYHRVQPYRLPVDDEERIRHLSKYGYMVEYALS